MDFWRKMMKNKITIIIFACVLVATFVLGVSGIVVFVKDEPTVNSNVTNNDMLIGVFITEEYLDLFDFEEYFQNNKNKVKSGVVINPSDKIPYEGKIYATLVDVPYTNPETGKTSTIQKYVFDDIEGIAFFTARYTDKDGMEYWGVDGDEAISDVHTSYNRTDAGFSIENKGTIYVDLSKNSNMFYYNPVYQTATGEVYLMSGTGRSDSGDLLGVSRTITLEEEQTITINGKTETNGSSIAITTCFMDPPLSTSLLQFDKNHKIISKEEYKANDFPSKITTDSDTEYIIVETRMKSKDDNATVSRKLFQQNDKMLFTFTCREDGICIKQYTSIVWK